MKLFGNLVCFFAQGRHRIRIGLDNTTGKFRVVEYSYHCCACVSLKSFPVVMLLWDRVGVITVALII